MKALGELAIVAGACLVWGSACGERTLLPRDGRILLSVGEAYQRVTEPAPPSILLSLETEMVYPCCNYGLVTRVVRAGGDIIADIQGVAVPEICLTALGPAGFGEFLDLEDGRYALEVRDGRERSAFWLTVDEESLTIQWQAEPGSGLAVPKYSVFWRYPRNSFAVLCGTKVETAWIYEDFLSRLREAVDLREITFPDYGELGYPRAPEGYWVNHPGRYFVYEGPEDFGAAGEVLEAYVHDVIGELPGVGIKLLNWQNEAFRSWLMD